MHANRNRGIFGLLLAVFCLSCDGNAIAPSTCDGLAGKLVGITRADYGPCAGEILAALEELERALRRIVIEEESAARPEAKAAYQRLRRLMSDVGFQADSLREARAGSPAARIERWPDGSMQSFNRDVGNAAAQFMSALGHPNEGNLREGSRHHALARRAYERFR